MNTLSVLYHLARADFLERIRRYSFLMILGLMLWIGYLSTSGQFRMRVPPDYLGVINSAWAGATMTITVSRYSAFKTVLHSASNRAGAAGRSLL